MCALAGLQVLWRAILSPYLQQAASPSMRCRAALLQTDVGAEGAAGAEEAAGGGMFSWGSSHFGVSSSLVDLAWFVGDVAQARARIECLLKGGALPALQQARLELQVSKQRRSIATTTTTDNYYYYHQYVPRAAGEQAAALYCHYYYY